MKAKLETIRAFVAVNLNLETIEAISDFSKQLKRDELLRGLKVTWVPPVNMHQTIRFLGGIDRELVEVVARKLEAVAERVAPFEVTARGLGCFPSPQSPRVLWVGLLDASSGLLQLYEELSRELEDVGFERERRPFHPHVTLGRVRHGRSDLGPLVQAHADRVFGTSPISELVLYESRLRRTGAEYVALARKPLVGPPPGPSESPAGREE